MSSVSSATPISRSPEPSSKRIASLPLVGMLANASMLLRRTVPRVVAKTTSSFAQSPSSSGSGMTVVMRSPCSSGSRLTKALPRAWGAARGKRHTFIL